MLLLFIYGASQFCWGCVEINVKFSEVHFKSNIVLLLVETFVPVLFHVKEIVFLYISFKRKRMVIFGDEQSEQMNYFFEKADFMTNLKNLYR
jgi:hypothetical protein